jgi:TolA-binding protein
VDELKRIIKASCKAARRKEVRRGFDEDLNLNREDSALFRTFGKYMKGRLDLEEARNDPSLPEIDKIVGDMISDYRNNSTKSTDDVNFIRDNFDGTNREKKILDEISTIKSEMQRSYVNDLSAEWVKEWHEKKKKEAFKEPKTDEIRDFITRSLENKESESEIKLKEKEDKVINRYLLIRYIALPAAAIIGVLILIRTLLPSSDPDNLYNSYYKPFSVISSVTRDAVANQPDKYSFAVEKYRTGDYQTAATGFSELMVLDSSSVPPRFFMGITQMALGNYDQAVSLLNGITDGPGEYRKEASWYLGLAYLKTGQKEKAARCFNLLVQSPGFYSERSGEVLRRLK